MSDRLDVRKTYKLLIKGAFPRSESGRVYEVHDANGAFLANVAWASRKDVRDAVTAARAGQASWAKATPYNRGQVLYRWAEMMESRYAELAEQVALAEGCSTSDASASVGRAIDLLVWYAGWTDKLAQVLGSANPVAGPFFNFSVPNPSGVVVACADQASSLEGFIEVVAPALAAGNAVVVVTSKERPIPAVLLAEMSAVSDFPAGLLNVLTGDVAELAETVARHEDVDGLDLTGAGEAEAAMAAWAAGSLKRVYRPRGDDPHNLRRLRTFVETTTVWHTIGQ